MPDILIISPERATAGPLASVVAALPEATVIDVGFYGAPDEAHAAALTLYTDEFRRLRPKLVIVLGDRYETHAAALAAHFLRIPIAHIHGGETTVGSFDDALRHGITHMATLHFVATESAATKVEAMTLHPYQISDGKSIHLVGAPGLDLIPQNCAKRDRKMIVVSYYSETTAPDYGMANCCGMLSDLDAYAADHAIFFSRPNSDPGSENIAVEIQKFIDRHPSSASWISPNTREQYLHLCEHAAVAVGNSSSLVIETPWMNLPSVIIGDRQDGRELAPSIVLAKDHQNIGVAIGGAIGMAWANEPIYRGGAAEGIAKVVREFVANV